MNVVYCTRGHYVATYNMAARSWQGVLRVAAEEERGDAPHHAKHCAACGSKNLRVCEHCETPMRPLTRSGGRPSYCFECAEPFPWTANALATAEEYTDELDTLTDEDKVVLKESFADLTIDTVRTPLAASRYNRIVSKLAPFARETLQKIIVEVITNSAKKIMGGP